MKKKYPPKKITREKLYQDILNTQNYLIKLKLNEKDTVVSMLENSYEQISFFLATLCLKFEIIKRSQTLIDKSVYVRSCIFLQ